MVFKYEGWTLYVIEPNLRGIGKRKMYFFSKRKPNRGTPCDMPEGFKVGVNKRTSLPYLEYTNKISLIKKRKQGLIK